MVSKLSCGENTLIGIIKTLASKAGCDTSLHWSGHSLRASTVSTLLEQNVTELEVRKVTGHRSTAGLTDHVRSSGVRKKSSLLLAAPQDKLNEQSNAEPPLIQCSSKDISYLKKPENHSGGSSGSGGSTEVVAKKRPQTFSNNDFDSDIEFEQELCRVADKAEKLKKIEDKFSFSNMKQCQFTFNFN